MSSRQKLIALMKQVGELCDQETFLFEEVDRLLQIEKDKRNYRPLEPYRRPGYDK